MLSLLLSLYLSLFLSLYLSLSLSLSFFSSTLLYLSCYFGRLKFARLEWWVWVKTSFPYYNLYENVKCFKTNKKSLFSFQLQYFLDLATKCIALWDDESVRHRIKKIARHFQIIIVIVRIFYTTTQDRQILQRSFVSPLKPLKRPTKIPDKISTTGWKILRGHLSFGLYSFPGKIFDQSPLFSWLSWNVFACIGKWFLVSSCLLPILFGIQCIFSTIEFYLFSDVFSDVSSTLLRVYSSNMFCAKYEFKIIWQATKF